MHHISTVEATTTSVTRECSCGWLTIGTIREPDFHTPLIQREADHLRDAQRIDDGTIWAQIPPSHTYQVHLRRRLRGGEPNQVVITAIWSGGSHEVLHWPWTADGLAQAQAWCNTHHVVWGRSHTPVGRDDLARHSAVTHPAPKPETT